MRPDVEAKHYQFADVQGVSRRDSFVRPRPHPRVHKLDTLGGTVTESGRVYREVRPRELPVADGSRLASIRAILCSASEGSALERRVAALEQQAETTGR